MAHRAATRPVRPRAPGLRDSDFDDRPGPGALHPGRPRPWWAAATLPLQAAALLAPTAAVLQSKAMAPIAILALLLAVLAHRREAGRWPRPGPVVLPLLALAAWGAATALWAVSPRAALTSAGTLAAFALLGAAGAAVVAEEVPAARRSLGACILAGLALGLATALVDDATGQWIRAAVRGLPATRPGLEFGLKPAASVMALMLPLVLRLRAPASLRWTVMGAGCVAILLLPGDTAKIAALAGLLVAGMVAFAGRAASNALALLLAAALLATPLLLPLALRPEVAAQAPITALHRLLIWDFARERAAERPLLGWGMEASRAIPGAQDNPSRASLARLGVEPTGARAWFLAPGVQRLPLHPHNGALQIWLELGWIGLALGAVAVLALGWGAGPVAAGILASAAVTSLASFGAWQAWWLASQALAAALAAGFSLRRD